MARWVGFDNGTNIFYFFCFFIIHLSLVISKTNLVPYVICMILLTDVKLVLKLIQQSMHINADVFVGHFLLISTSLCSCRHVPCIYLLLGISYNALSVFTYT